VIRDLAAFISISIFVVAFTLVAAGIA